MSHHYDTISLWVVNPCSAEPKFIFFENTVDPDQMASAKPSGLDPQRFPPGLKMNTYDWNAAG